MITFPWEWRRRALRAEEVNELQAQCIVTLNEEMRRAQEERNIARGAFTASAAEVASLHAGMKQAIEELKKRETMIAGLTQQVRRMSER